MNKINTAEVLTKEEIALAEEYIRNYAYDAAYVDESQKIPFVDILDMEWAHCKYRFYKAFGEKLILSKKIKVGKSNEELEVEFDARRQTPGNPIDVFYNNFYQYFCSLPNSGTKLFYRGWSYDSVVEWACYNLMSYPDLVKNVVPEGDVVVVPSDENHKEFKIQPGCKIMKALGKIAERYGIEGFEEFRLEHSRILNTPLSEEELCISIHPLDFITMSENDCGWQSCMNWHEKGCYRMGTVEMMNSPCVIVAYLKSEKDMTRFGYQWNNKKWRQLFIVINEAIIGVKAYPYRSESASKEAAAMIAEVFSDRDYDMSNFNSYEWDCGTFFNDAMPYSKSVINIEPETNTMYNDFGAAMHDIVFTKSIYQSILDNDFQSIYFNYSGLDQCMLTGKSVRNDWCAVESDWDDEIPAERLICVSCEPPRKRCDICGSYHYETETVIIDDGTSCCPWCAAHRTDTDVLTGLTYRHDSDDLTWIRLACGEYNPVSSWQYISVRTKRDNLFNGEWEKVFPPVQQHGTGWYKTYWININDCSNEAKKKIEDYILSTSLYDVYSSLEDYITSCSRAV